MTQQSPTSRNNALFARKGDAAPAPAVGYVSLRALQGKPERRRAQARFDGLERRRSVLERLLGAPRPRPQDDLAAAVAAPPPTGAAPSPLSTLIQRQAAEPEPGAAARSLAIAAADDDFATPMPRFGHGRGTGTASDAGDRRVQFTVRLGAEEATRLKAHAELRHATYQDVLAAATRTYLERAVPAGASAADGAGSALWRRLIAGGRESAIVVETDQVFRRDPPGSTG